MVAFWQHHPILTIVAIILLVGVLFVASQVLWIIFSGRPVPRPSIPGESQTIGRGEPLTFVVLGDSTAVSQGGDYAQGYAAETAEFLAENHEVTWSNVAVSGARARDVWQEQIPKATKQSPDIALVAVGANDVTHLTSLSAVRNSLENTIAALRASNPAVKIVLTGAPDMGSVPRFPQPTRWLAGQRTQAVNRIVAGLAREQNVLFAPIAEKTGPAFRQNPGLFSADKFHPTAEGYALWTPVIIDTLSNANIRK